VLTHNELQLTALELKNVLMFEHTSKGKAKTAFMEREQELTGQPFGDYEVKLLCEKANMKMLFPEANITLQFVNKYKKNKAAVNNYMRVRDDAGEVTPGSSADFLDRVYRSRTVDIDYHPHLMINEATNIVRALGFDSILDTTTEVPLPDITPDRIGEPLKKLQILSHSRKGTSENIKTVVSGALAAAVGVKLKVHRLGKRKRSEGGHVCKLEVTEAVQELVSMPNELMSEHWYRKEYKCDPPHYQDRLSVNDLPRLRKLYHTYKTDGMFKQQCAELQQKIEQLGGNVH
jgi:hypothetical protein